MGRLTRELARLWEAPELLGVKVEFSARLRSSLGRCYPSRAVVRLNARLLEDLSTLLSETLCHELAHLVVHQRYGRVARPHGPEWRALMEAAGHPPRTGVPVTHVPRQIYVHRCPVCGTARRAGRAMPRWRCAACLEDGLSGEMLIMREGPR